MSISKDLENRNALFRDLENGMSKAPDQGQSAGAELPSQSQGAATQSKGGSVLDRALDLIAEKGKEKAAEAEKPGLTSGPRDQGMEM